MVVVVLQKMVAADQLLQSLVAAEDDAFLGLEEAFGQYNEEAEDRNSAGVAASYAAAAVLLACAVGAYWEAVPDPVVAE
jgi:hypothetical protein